MAKDTLTESGYVLRVRMTNAQRRLLEPIAKRAGLKLSSWVRALAMREERALREADERTRRR